MPTIAEQLTQLTQDRDDLVDNLTTKGITGLTGDETFTELVPEVLNIPSGGGTEPEEKDVNFYDYDGTRLYSYTASEFNELSEFPENPQHDGLTSQGWNWTLTNAKTVVGQMGMLNIGQNYVTDDGKTRVYIELLEGKTTPTLGFAATSGSTITIDWGDESGVQTETATNEYMYFTHEYSSPGNYVISIGYSDTLIINGNNNDGYGTYLLTNNLRTQNSSDMAYRGAIKKIELGNNVRLNDGALHSCYNLETITIPQIVIPPYADPLFNATFKNCYSLKNFVMPKDGYQSKGYAARESHFENCYSLKRVQSCYRSGYGPSCFKNCGGLDSKQIIGHKYFTVLQGYFLQECNTVKEIYVDSNIFNISDSAFQNCRCLNSVVCFGNITNIGTNAFYNAKSLSILDLSHNTSIPTLSANVFNGIDCKIIVPDDLYEDWIVATNWSTYASQIVKASEA